MEEEKNTEILENNATEENNMEPVPEIDNNEFTEEVPEIDESESTEGVPEIDESESTEKVPEVDETESIEGVPEVDNSTEEVLDTNDSKPIETQPENNQFDTPMDENEKNTIPESPVEKVDEKIKKPGKKKPVKVFVILLLLIGIGVGIYFYLTNQKTTSTVKPSDKKSAYRISSNDLTDFDLKFLQLENTNKNKIYSPLSIKYALAMLKEGANGESKDQITNIIGDYKSKKYNNNQNMSFANAMFIKEESKQSIKEDYTNTLKEKYNAEVVYDSFETPNNLNKWVSDKTFGLVQNIFDSTITSYSYVITNALAIDMNWNNQIQCASGSDVSCKDYSGNYAHEKGEEGSEFSWGIPMMFTPEDYHSLKFDGKDNIKSVEIGAVFNRYNIVKELGEDKIRKTVGDEYKKWLTSEEGQLTDEKDVDKYLDKYIEELNENYDKGDYSTDFLFYNDKNVKAFAKDLKTYDGTTLQYVGIMPKKEKLDKYVKNTNANKIGKIIKNLKEFKKESFKDGVVTKVYGYIPLFKFDYELSLKDDLHKLGIKNVFKQDLADLSNLTKEKTYIDKVAHKANIEFSNDGIKAAAATVEGGLGATSGGFNYLFDVPIEKIDLTFDKPYMFLIRDKKTGEVWFTGTVYEPITK